jgi:ribosomal protein S18 acetylase RimI-like enzyme
VIVTPAIRLATERDADGLAILAVSFARANPSVSPTAAEDLASARASVETLLAASGLKAYVAHLHEDVVAVMVLAAVPSLVHGGRPTFFVELLVVAEAYRRQGIATAMVRHAIALGRAVNAYKVLLVTGTDNVAASALYTACGFESNGIGVALYL